MIRSSPAPERQLRVAAVIVTYHKPGPLRTLLEDLRAQTRPPDEIVVIDNGDDARADAMVRQAFPEVRYVRLDANRGSAGGFREGIRLAAEQSDLIWLLDDDVRADPDALQPLVAAMAQLGCREKVGAVRSWGLRECEEEEPFRAGGFAWRGTLVTAAAVRDIGLPRSELFLYGDDMEYSRRMTRQGYAIYWVPASRVIEVPSGDKDEFSLFGKKTVVYRDAFRLYYAHRNQICLYSEWGDIAGVARSIGYAAKALLYFFFMKRPRGRAEALAVVRGVRDGLLRRSGVCPAYVPLRP